jgi:hypothetical protein
MQICQQFFKWAIVEKTKPNYIINIGQPNLLSKQNKIWFITSMIKRQKLGEEKRKRKSSYLVPQPCRTWVMLAGTSPHGRTWSCLLKIGKKNTNSHTPDTQILFQFFKIKNNICTKNIAASLLTLQMLPHCVVLHCGQLIIIFFRCKCKNDAR